MANSMDCIFVKVGKKTVTLKDFLGMEDSALSENEIKKDEEFEEKHKKCYRPTTIGVGIEYKFFPNAIGTGVSIKCGFCGEEENITDYDLW